MKYKQIVDGEIFYVKSGEVHKMACCDCGLVHDFIFTNRVDAKAVQIQAKRNKRATAARRRNK